MTAPNPCKLQHFLHLLNRFFALMNAKNAGIYAFPKKIEDPWRERNPVNNSVLATFGDQNCGIYAGSCQLTAQNAVNYSTCALFMFNFQTRDAFTCSLHYIFCILPQETTLQIETGRQRDPKESWREETHRSFYPHTQGLLHREVFTLRCFCRQTSRSFYTQKFLHEEVFTQRVFYTQTRLHTEAFTQRSLYTEECLHTINQWWCKE